MSPPGWPAAGHEVVAVDQRGHGHSEQCADGYTTAQCATDLAQLLVVLGFTGDRAPVVAGQSWGGNVVVDLAARHGGVAAAVALIDGGWIRLSDRFATFDECWEALEPPSFDNTHADELTGWLADAHPDWSAEGHRGHDGELRAARRRSWCGPGCGGTTTARSSARCSRSEPASAVPGHRRCRCSLVPVIGDPPGEVDAQASRGGGGRDACCLTRRSGGMSARTTTCTCSTRRQIADDLLGLLRACGRARSMSRLVVMGSGETAPTMVRVHREILATAGEGPAAMLDTPFAFQMNADELVARTLTYFEQSVGVTVEVASWPRRDAPTVVQERALALLGRARWAFAGPGSPTYALRQWRGTGCPGRRWPASSGAAAPW